MTSARQIAANRRNARRSTGPRTSRGKADASRNALRHGLAANVLADPRLADKIRQLAIAIAGKGASPSESEQAAIVAQAQILLERVRDARVALIDRRCAARPREDSLEPSGPGLCLEGAVDRLSKLDRYEERALSRRKRAIRTLSTTAGTSPMVRGRVLAERSQ